MKNSVDLVIEKLKQNKERNAAIVAEFNAKGRKLSLEERLERLERLHGINDSGGKK